MCEPRAGEAEVQTSRASERSEGGSANARNKRIKHLQQEKNKTSSARTARMRVKFLYKRAAFFFYIVTDGLPVAKKKASLAR